MRPEHSAPGRPRARTLLGGLLACALAASLLYALLFVNPKFLGYVMNLRLPRLAAIVLAAVAISAASVVFQTIVRNRIVTPCLLGMNSLYVLIHTATAFLAGAGSLLASSPVATFLLDIAVMGAVAGLVYWKLFERTGGSVLYILLIGTVLATLFSSIQGTLVRIMDPNDYDALLGSLVASFTNVNATVLPLAAGLLALIAFILRRDLATLDVIALGRDAATSLGADHRRIVMRLLIGVALSIAVATAVVGPLSFLGLITANIARELGKTYRHAVLIPASALAGVTLLALGELVVERAAHSAIPVSVFVTLAGGAYFLWLILSSSEAHR